MTAPARKTVTVDGITWTIHSRNERSATVNGRHLFAVRCTPSHSWALIEHDKPMQTGAREIARHGYCITAHIGATAKAIPPRQFYSVVRAALSSFGRAVLHVMSPGGIVEATFYGDRYAEHAAAIAAELNAGGAA